MLSDIILYIILYYIISYIYTYIITCHIYHVIILCYVMLFDILYIMLYYIISYHVWYHISYHIIYHVISYRVSQEERTKLRESVPYVKLYRYNPKHLYPKLNGYGDIGHRKVWAFGVSTYCTPSVTPYSPTAHARQRDTAS